ncbi:MAG: TylF/MycF family methyltransferase [Cyclobacteriaceae bacterium]|nr:TylF/MycF family methyltransferase [Cyclobacteriaceae bacterium]
MELNNYDTDKLFEYENGYHTVSKKDRFGKFLAHYELYKRITDLPGHIVECGVFKGNSLFRFASFRDIVETTYSRKIIGFDVFGDFPATQFNDDKKYLEKFISAAGSKSITVEELRRVLEYKNIENVELVKGDITATVPQYCKENAHLKIALLHLDVDIYEPAVTILENLFDKVVKGGVIMFDDYGTFPGETKAVDDFFKDYKVQKLPISHIPSYIIKE